MSNSVMIDTALRLPAPDIEALIQGRTIVAMPRQYIEPGQFALYPCDASINILPAERYYRPDFLPFAQTAFEQLDSETVLIKAWASCERCQILDSTEPLDRLSRLTIWKAEALQEIVSQREYIY